MFGVEGAGIERFVESATRTRASAFRKATYNVVSFEMPASVMQITTQTLFVAGAREHPLILSSLSKFKDALPFASHFTIPGGGHGWSGTMPKEFASILKKNIVSSN